MTRELLEKAKNIEYNIHLCEDALRTIENEKGACPSIYYSGVCFNGLNAFLPKELNPQFEKIIRDYKAELEYQLSIL